MSTTTDDGAHPLDRLFVWMQYLLPQHFLSRLVYRATRVRAGWFKNPLIRAFIRAFGVDMSDAAETRPEAFEHFNAFFTRALLPGARPLPESPGAVVSPVDGTVSMAGEAEGQTLIQAKDRRYALADLVGDAELAAEFAGGSFATLYLAPYNYHRIHMPVDGRLTGTVYLPGRLFSVNAATVRSVPRLFARNERVVCRFDTPAGGLLMILVGALNVGSIETVWAGELAPGRPRRKRSIPRDRNVSLARGEEMGRFNMGSTVILVFQGGGARLDTSLAAGTRVRMGMEIGSIPEVFGQASRDLT